jgi:indolepyruvate decarboxylase
MPALPDKPELACMNLIESLLHALKDHGARQIFGIPGDFALPYFRIIEESKILPLYTLSHEPGVGFAADASARINGSLGVAAVTYGAGALNMINSIAAAFAEKSPLVVLSGGPGKGRIALRAVAAPPGQDAGLAVPDLQGNHLRPGAPGRRRARAGRHRPRAGQLPAPLGAGLHRDPARHGRTSPARRWCPMPPQPVDPDALAACVDEILARLASARSPVLMAGVEVRRYGLEAKVAQLARRLGMPVVTGFMGRGLLADQDVPLLGTYMGVAGFPEVTHLVESSDGLFLLGEIICDTNFAVSETKIDMRKTIQALDGRVTIGYHTYSNLPLAAVVERMLACVSAGDKPLAVTPPVFPHGLVADGASITPTDIATAVNDLMAAHGKMPMASDMGDCLFTAMEIQHTALVAPGYYATMGFGVPAGLGLQAATAERPLILVGDGAFQMTGWELGNCQRYGWDPIVLVFNNASWEMLRTFQPESGFNDLSHWGFAEMAAGMGGDGVRVNTRAELKAALDHAMATRGRFQLIDITIPSGVLSQTLARFVAGVKRLNAVK